MARTYNIGPYNCGLYQAGDWDHPCEPEEEFKPVDDCTYAPFEELECGGRGPFTEQEKADVAWTEEEKASTNWTEQ